jgi:hypothetical protein
MIVADIILFSLIDAWKSSDYIIIFLKLKLSILARIHRIEIKAIT